MDHQKVGIEPLEMTPDDRREYQALLEKKNKFEKDYPVIVAAAVVIILCALIVACVSFANIERNGGADLLGGILAAIGGVVLIGSQTAKKNGLQDQVDALVRQQTAKRDLMKQVLDEAAQSGFEANSVVTDTTNTRCIAIDAHRRKFLLKPTPGEDYAVYDYADLIDFSLSQDGSTLITGTSGDAFIGSLFMGTTGAVIGAAGPRQLLEFCSDLHIELVLNDTENPRVVLPLISTEMPKSSPEYKYVAERAKEMIALLQIVRSHAQRPQPDRQPVQEAIPAEAREAPDAETAALPAASEAELAQAAEQVRLYKELFDEGLLTREEFEAKRKELLRV